MVKVPFSKRERPPMQPIPADPVSGIDIPGVDGISETAVKRALIKMIDWGIDNLLALKARLRAPVKAADMPEIEEEDQ